MSVNYLAIANTPMNSHYVNEIGKYTIEEMAQHMREWAEYKHRRMIEEFGRIFNLGVINICREMQDKYKFKWITTLDIHFSDCASDCASNNNSDISINVVLLLQNLKAIQIARIT